MAIYFGKDKQIKNCVLNNKFVNPSVIGKTDIAGYFELDGCSSYDELVNNLVIPSNYEISSVNNQSDAGDIEGISPSTLKLITRKSSGTGDYVIKTKMACDYFVFGVYFNSEVNSAFFTLRDTNGNPKLQIKISYDAGSIFSKSTYYYEVVSNGSLIAKYSLSVSRQERPPACKIGMAGKGINKPYTNVFEVQVGNTSLCKTEIEMVTPLYAEITHRITGFGTYELEELYIYHYDYYKGIPQINS